MTTPFVVDLGFSRADYANIVKGVGLAATLIGGFAGGFVARALPLGTSLWIGAILQMASNLVFTWQALVGVNHVRAHRHDHRRELHRRDRHGDLRRLPLGAVQKPAAYRDAVRAADRAGGGRTHLPVRRRRLRRGGDRLADLLRDQRRGRACRASCCWPGCRRAGTSTSWGRPGSRRLTIDHSSLPNER